MSAEEESLSQIIQTSFGGKAPETAKGEQTAKPAEAAPPAVDKPEAKTETVEAKPDTRDEKGRFAKTEEKPAEKPQETKPRADVAAIIDERRKRQAAEDRVAELLRAQQKPTERPSVFENEDAAISSRVDEGNRPLREAIYKLSVKSARAIYKDFGDAENAFMEAMEKDERLIRGLQASDDPGEFIYSMGIHIRELADVGGDIVKYRDKVTAGSKVQMDALQAQFDALKAENEALKKSQADLDSVPRSLNNASSGASPRAGSEDDEDIKSIARFGNKQR